jgi:hypothetical protein
MVTLDDLDEAGVGISKHEKGIAQKNPKKTRIPNVVISFFVFTFLARFSSGGGDDDHTRGY